MTIQANTCSGAAFCVKMASLCQSSMPPHPATVRAALEADLARIEDDVMGNPLERKKRERVDVDAIVGTRVVCYHDICDGISTGTVRTSVLLRSGTRLYGIELDGMLNFPRASLNFSCSSSSSAM